MFGPSEVRSHKGAQIEIWEVDKSGTVAVGARLSSDDAGKEQKTSDQIKSGLNLCEQIGKSVRYVVASTGMSGDRSEKDRPDLEFMRIAIERGHIDTVVFREVDRLARRSGVRDEFWRFLEETGTELYFSLKGRVTDWDSDRLTLDIEGGMADHERRLIWRRTRTGIDRNMLDIGWGWPGCVRFGFKRLEDSNEIVVDAEQWKSVKRIHEDYSKVGPTGRGSISRLRAHMAKLRCPISEERLRTILKDEIYVTGNWGVTVKGEFRPGNKIEIDDPIPADLQAKNLALMKNTNGRNSRTPYGAYLLNNIPLFHARCMDQLVERKQPRTGNVKLVQPQLRGRGYNGRRAKRPLTYTHYPITPHKCRGLAIPAAMLEDTVVKALLELAGSPDLQRAYIQRSSEDDPNALTTENPKEIDREIRSLLRGRQEILAAFTDEVRTGDTSAKFRVAKLLEGIDADIEALSRRKEIALAARKDQDVPSARDLRGDMETILRAGPKDSDELRQRKMALIDALLSKVVVHDSEGSGYEVELFGHLIPTGRTMIPIELQHHLDRAVDESHKPAAKRTLTSRFVTDWGGLLAQVPAWRSERISVPELPFGHSLEDAKKCIRFAHTRLEAGRMFGRGMSPYEVLRRENPQLLRSETLARICRQHGTTRDRLIRSTLKVEDGLRTGRFGPRSVSEIRMTITWALEDGMTMDPGWAMRWDSFARGRSYLESYAWLNELLRKEGTSVKVLASQIHVTKTEGQRQDTQTTDPIVYAETPSELKDESLTSSELKKETYDGGKLILFRQKNRLFYLKFPKDQNFYYPAWQFDESLDPRPIVSKVLSLVADLDLDVWDLERVMSERVEFEGQDHRLRDLVSAGIATEWLFAQLKYRLEATRHAKSLRSYDARNQRSAER